MQLFGNTLGRCIQFHKCILKPHSYVSQRGYWFWLLSFLGPKKYWSSELMSTYSTYRFQLEPRMLSPSWKRRATFIMCVGVGDPLISTEKHSSQLAENLAPGPQFSTLKLRHPNSLSLFGHSESVAGMGNESQHNNRKRSDCSLFYQPCVNECISYCYAHSSTCQYEGPTVPSIVPLHIRMQFLFQRA